MNLGDYLLPWKAIPNMVKDVKAASKTKDEDGKKNYDSVFGAIGKYADPFGALLGDNWMDFWHGTVPREVNRIGSDFSEFHREKLDPIWRLGGKRAVGGYDGDFYNITDTKSGDISAAILASVLGGMALGGAAGGSSGGSGFSNPYNFSNMDWTNPQTYTRLQGMMPQQQQQMQYQPPNLYEEARKRELERKRQYDLLAQYLGA